MTPSLSWPEFYRPRMESPTYQDKFREKYALFIERLKEEMNESKPSFIEEHGCGIGTVTKELLRVDFVVKHRLLDRNPEMIGLASENIRHPNVSFERWDIRVAYPKRRVNLIHSHGVLEHFSDQDITEILRHQRATGATVIHYVPTNKYEKPKFGDERLLSRDYWKSLIRPDSIIEFNDGKDLIMEWRGRS